MAQTSTLSIHRECRVGEGASLGEWDQLFLCSALTGLSLFPASGRTVREDVLKFLQV